MKESYSAFSHNSHVELNQRYHPKLINFQGTNFTSRVTFRVYIVFKSFQLVTIISKRF